MPSASLLHSTPKVHPSLRAISGVRPGGAKAAGSAASARIPAARWGEPEDLGGAAVFLASRASDYVNGHVLVVDGGWMAR